MKLSIIIVNYNGEHFLKTCLDSVFDSVYNEPFEVIVVDNASRDRSLAVLESYGNKIQLIANRENFGFSKANNQGLVIAKGNYIFFLNNDTKLNKETLQKCIQYYDGHSHIGALGPKLLNADGSIQGQGSLLGHWRFHSKKPKAVSFISGAAFFTTRAIMMELGGMDEQFFFYNEDIDLCMRIRKKGSPLMYYPEAQLIHFGGLSTASRKPESIIEGYRGGLYLGYKHYPFFLYHVYRVVLFVDLIPRILWHGLLSFFQKKHTSFLRAYLKIGTIAIRNEIFYSQRHK